jgi:hypothetical protein
MCLDPNNYYRAFILYKKSLLSNEDKEAIFLFLRNLLLLLDSIFLRWLQAECT